MPQITYQDQSALPAFEGGLYDSGPNDIVSRTPGANVKQLSTLTIGTPTAAVAQVERLTVDTAVAGDTLVITIGRYVFTITTVGTDKTVQRDAILTAMALNEDFVVEYTAVAQSTDSIDVTAVRTGTPFHIHVTASGAGVAQIDTLTIGTPTVAVAQKMTLTVDTADAGDTFVVKINGVTVATGTTQGSDKTVERDAVEALMEANAYFVANFTSTDNSTDALDIEALVAGEPFTMEETVESTSAWSIAEDTANIVGTQFKFEMDDKVFQYAAATTNITTERDALLTLLQADTDFDDLVGFTASSTNLILVTSLVAGVAFTMTYANESPKGDVGVGTVTFTTTTPNVATSTYSWAQQTGNTIGTQFKFIIDERELLYGAGSATIETERDALLVLLQADSFFALEVVFAAQSTDAITITAVTAGNSHTITYQNENGAGVAGAGTVALVATTANVTGNPVPMGRGLARTTTVNFAVLPAATGFTWEGISVYRAKARPKDNTVSPPVTGDVVFRAAESMGVLRSGRIWVRVEDAVTLASGVFLRHTQGANALHTVGRFRGADVSLEVDEITSGARWITAASAGALAVLEIDVINSALT